MKKEQLGIAIIGCGMVGKFHLKALAGIPEFRVAGVWAANASLAGEVARDFNTNNYQTYQEALVDPEVDLVDICLPSGLHAEYGCVAALAGKHVLVEKPIDISLENAQRLIDTCRDCGVFLSVIFQNRFAPAAARVKQAMEEGVLGKLYAAEATIKWFRQQSYYTTSRWKGTKHLDGGGALINQGVHTIDLLLWFIGSKPKMVTSLVRTSRHPIEVEDLAMALVEFENGIIGCLTGSTALKPGFPERIELFGEKGTIALEAGRIARWKVDGCKEEDYLDAVPSGSGSSDPGGIPLANHQRQLKAIGQAILAGKQPPLAGEEALKALDLILKIYAANGKWIAAG
ncbi:MAG: Gfo/Idh/MocA family oxidoreductase [Syntrophomonadaceae bacterium]|nr:Gfo/Idh/MocA family oxidoreductase [Syntrophomonadaceae bacterium]